MLVDEADGIIAGHGRVLAAHKLGIAEIPVMVAAGWTAAQKHAYVLADNKLALNAGWDDAMLRVEIDDLQGGFDLGLIGFSADEIAALTFDKNAGLTNPDEAPDAPAALRVAAGFLATFGCLAGIGSSAAIAPIRSWSIRR